MTESADYVQFAPALRKFFECIHLRVNTRCGFAVQASRKKPPQFLMASVSATASTASRIIALRDTPLYAVAHIAHWQAALSLLSSAKSTLSAQKYAGKYHTIRRHRQKTTQSASHRDCSVWLTQNIGSLHCWRVATFRVLDAESLDAVARLSACDYKWLRSRPTSV